MPRKVAAAPGHVCPGIRIHTIDIVQPPAMRIPPMPDIDAHHRIVTAVLAAKSSAAAPRKLPSETTHRGICRPRPKLTAPILFAQLPRHVPTAPHRTGHRLSETLPRRRLTP